MIELQYQQTALPIKLQLWNDVIADIHNLIHDKSLWDQYLMQREKPNWRLVIENNCEVVDFPSDKNPSFGLTIPPTLWFTEFFVWLTTQHTADAIFSDEKKEEFEIIYEKVKKSWTVTLSAYLSLEKFANPLKTDGSYLWIEWIHMVQERKSIIEHMQKLWIENPKFLIMNETPANIQFTNADIDWFLHQIQQLLKDFSIEDCLEIRSFDKKFFTDYLDVQGISDSSSFFDAMYETMCQMYAHLHDNQNIDEGIVEKLSPQCFSDDQKNKRKSFFLDNQQAICNEIKQTIRTEKQSVDASFLWDIITRPLYETLLNGKLNNGNWITNAITGTYLSSLAYSQWIHFKILMRMRYVFQCLFKQPLLDEPNLFPLSITNVSDKVSFPCGRIKDTWIFLPSFKNGNECIPWMMPQHAVGVVVPYQWWHRIVCIPYKYIVDNSQFFQKSEYIYGEKKYSCYLYQNS